MKLTYRTPKGTELPILNLKGKEYLTVPYRVVWFREEHPDWRIETRIVTHEPDYSIFEAKILNESGHVMSMAHKSETTKGFADHLEKAETGAIGRALALVGYGTAFCADELDEGVRLADSPVSPKIAPQTKVSPKPAVTGVTQVTVLQKTGPGFFKIPFGKFKGLPIGQVPETELEGYLTWCEKKNAADKKVPSIDLTETRMMFERFKKQLSEVKPGQPKPVSPPWDQDDDWDSLTQALGLPDAKS